MSVTIHHGDCLDVLRGMAEASIDSVVTDPPYHLTNRTVDWAGFKDPTDGGRRGSPRLTRAGERGFMGKKWDGGDVAFRPETWAEVLRVMRPGAHLVAFGGTRTYHRMACAIEDAGFEIRDQLAWCFGTGFPKSHNLPGGLGTALKPAWEPIVLARKPLACPTVAAQVLATGTGALNVDGCRVPMGGEYDPAKVQRQSSARVTWKEGEASGFGSDHEQPTYNPSGRWPANLVTDGSPEVLEAFAAFGTSRDGVAVGGKGRASSIFGTKMDRAGGEDHGYGGGGSPARFFYSSKASKADRCGSLHPTIKPVALMRWLCRLVTPPGGTILDPFAGSGTTGEAALREGFSAVLIEREAEYHADIIARLARHRAEAPLLAEVAA